MNRSVGHIVFVILVCVHFAPPSGHSQAKAQPSAQLAGHLKLRNVPSVELATPIDREDGSADEIRSLIVDLAKIDSPEFGLSGTLSGTAFAPLEGFEEVGTALLARHQIKRNETIRKLVVFGPRALPLLLKSIDDATPTKLVMRHDTPFFGGIVFSTAVRGNPLNDAETRALADLIKDSSGSSTWNSAGNSFTVKVGDVCFVIIGQIVGRRYTAVGYVPTAIVQLTSPTHDPQIAAAVRAIWRSDNPSQHLLNSLLLDYSTEGTNDDSNRRGWNVGSDLQLSAALRMLYYFPKETAPLIADRLRGLKVYGVGPGAGSRHSPSELQALLARQAENGVRADRFVKAVSWCTEPVVQAELVSIFKRTTDPDVLTASVVGIGTDQSALILARLTEFLNTVPDTERGPFGDAYHVLIALGEHAGPNAKTTFASYLANASARKRLIICRVLRRTRGEWSQELLGPLLSDTRTSGYSSYAISPDSNEPRLPIRICDEAATTISSHLPGISFELVGTHENLDRQIALIRLQLKAE